MKSRFYDTDLDDFQWSLISPLIADAKFGGRPRSTDVRDVVNAVLYVVRTGCQWRMLPIDFPPWQTVYRYFRSWQKDGTIRRMHRLLYKEARRAIGRKSSPTLICIDSQSVKTGKAGGDRGYDGGKKVKGRKRHIVVDSTGLLVEAAITTANTHDTAGAKKVLLRMRKWIKSLPRKLYADGGYDGRPFKRWVRSEIGASMEIAKNLAQIVKRFVPAKKRWVVERTFAWFGDYRRLDKDHERLKSSSLAMLRFSMIALTLKRLSD